MYKFFKRITCNHDWELLSFRTEGGGIYDRTYYIKKCTKCLTVVDTHLSGWKLTEDQLTKFIN